MRILLYVLLALVSVVAFGQVGERVLKPVIEVGDRWTYRGANIVGPDSEEYEVEVTSVRSGVIQVVCRRKRDGKEFDGTFTDEWSTSTSCSGFVERPPSRFLQFPLVVGDSYSVKYASHRVRKYDFINDVEGQVVVREWESVEVPAGRFRAIRVEADLIVSIPGGSIRRHVKAWYSPEVRRTVKTESVARGGDTYTTVLLAYKLVQ